MDSSQPDDKQKKSKSPFVREIRDDEHPNTS
jgi:hypothetical protein